MLLNDGQSEKCIIPQSGHWESKVECAVHTRGVAYAILTGIYPY